MCCLFGIYDYGHSLTAAQKKRLVSALAIASEDRGTDATGIAYNHNGHLTVYKRPYPAHLMRFKLPDDALCVMGHTRMTTQGDEKHNYNNHPFEGTAGIPFALAHNGVLYNDLTLRKDKKLPRTRIETDSYVAVQLLAQQGELSFRSIRSAVEPLRGTLTLSVLDSRDNLHIIKGNNPLTLYHFPRMGLFVYAKAVKADNTIDAAFLQKPRWELELQKALGKAGVIKMPTTGYRYRYDLLANGTRDTTYVVATPARLLQETGQKAGQSTPPPARPFARALVGDNEENTNDLCGKGGE